MKIRHTPFLFACIAGSLLAANEPPSMLGFSTERAAAQLGLEKAFDAQLSPADLRGWLERMSAEPNHVGAPHNKANAEFTLEQFRAWGWDAHIETFMVMYPTPKKMLLEMTEPVKFTAKLHEPALSEDRTSGVTKDALPPYHGYGADGDVTGELVYVNRGMPDDYKELARHGISVKGRIVIARYGGGWRGLKPKLAYEHGAIGCLVYSDPADDGYATDDTYPKGGSRPADAVQRGSVADMPVYAGDPTTPGYGSTPDAKHLPVSEAKTILKIPVMPISYADAQPLLAALTGPVAPAAWRGALPITYHMGPGGTKVHLAIESDWKLTPCLDVIAVLRGSEFPDEWLMRGNHRDGWVFGAWDPLSGHVAMMAEAKAIGALAQQGWKPKRTLVYCSWDGEEIGLLGSTEWGETHAEELQRKAVLYLNSDTNTRGFLQPGGSHALQTLVNEAAGTVRDPQTGVSVLARLRAKLLVAGAAAGAKDEAKVAAKFVAANPGVPLEALGSGSDFTPFLQHLGIATLSIEYGGEDKQDGVYHSIYDSFDHYIRFGDPKFEYGIALAQTVGRVMLRLADAEVLPMRFTDFSSTVEQYAEEVHKLADDLRESTAQANRLLDAHAFQLAADPTLTYVPPDREADVPFLNLTALDNATLRLKASALACDTAFTAAMASGTRLTAAQHAELDDLMRGLEHTLTNDAGLPGRDWFKHMIYAPGLLTGYGVKTLPGVREAIEDRNWPVAEHYAEIAGASLDGYRQRLDKITTILQAAGTKN
jgi:N-acetylated-alpha-linked acidic dipeptidase